MTSRFFDSSALVKRYAGEPGSAAVDRAFRETNPMATSWTAVLEVISVLVRMRNDGRITPTEHSDASFAFGDEVFDSKPFLVLAPGAEVFVSAIPLISLHNINASDALILETARRWFSEAGVGPGEFWTSDRRLVRAARAEGMLVVDPSDPSLELPTERSAPPTPP